MSDSASAALACGEEGQAQHSRIMTPLGVTDTFKHDLGSVAAALNVVFFLSHSP